MLLVNNTHHIKQGIIRAYEINPELAMLVASKDEEGIPIYNQYQMYEVTEGIRLHLDVSSYYQPSYTDLQMRLKREELIKIEERRTGRKFKERILSKSNIKLDDDQLNTIIQDMDTEPSLAVILTARCRLIILHFQEEAA